MNIRIRYEEQPGIEVKNISVLGSFCGYDKEKGKMQQTGTGWFYEGEAPPGDYYYKFLINDTLLLNDPLANCYAPRSETEEELWSFLKISTSGERLYDNTQYYATVEKYQLSAMVTEGECPEKKEFSTLLDKRAVARFGFNRVKGLHPVTLLWSDCTGEIKEYAENVLFEEEDPEKITYLWFWLDIKKLEETKGTWKWMLFIDGKYVLEDRFRIGNAFLYSRDGKLQNN